MHVFYALVAAADAAGSDLGDVPIPEPAHQHFRRPIVADGRES